MNKRTLLKSLSFLVGAYTLPTMGATTPISDIASESHASLQSIHPESMALVECRLKERFDGYLDTRIILEEHRTYARHETDNNYYFVVKLDNEPVFLMFCCDDLEQKCDHIVVEILYRLMRNSGRDVDQTLDMIRDYSSDLGAWRMMSDSNFITLTYGSGSHGTTGLIMHPENGDISEIYSDDDPVIRVGILNYMKSPFRMKRRD